MDGALVSVFRVAVDAEAEVVENERVGDPLDSRPVLDINAVTPTMIGAEPAVVVDDAAVYLRVRRGTPESDAVPCIVNDEVDELRAGAEDVHTVAEHVGLTAG